MAACRQPSKLLALFRGEVRAGDLRDPDYLDRVLTGIDIICHTAGRSSFENTGKNRHQSYLEPSIDLINRAVEWRVKRVVNLSSIFVASTAHRNYADAKGSPRSYWPMINSIIAVEDYLRNYQTRCQFVNLRAAIFSGKRLNIGLLPLLLARNMRSGLPYINGKSGFFPLVDGQDIGQAFARAALAPLDGTYNSFNISGPDTPSQAEVMQFIAQQLGHSPLQVGLPAALTSTILWTRGKLQKQASQPLFTSAMLDALKTPVIDNISTVKALGYDPKISWQATLLDTLENHKNHSLNYDLSKPDRALNIR
ncbi:hypothetical protein MNBD_GAMMA09-2515 [hydrothermal vent metagenome]|uniref:NAD-dependent epimerase/dehydratase domain-containing protein n=1 Tax=hydrothermal vent metagenome TaxID=652676 RepID=A0A3B0YKV2_9ZZZZ